MRAFFFVFLLITDTAMSLFSQYKTIDRQPYVAGRFYPDDKQTLRNDLEDLFREYSNYETGTTVRGIIAPHAGYVFSGKTAAAAFSTIPRDAEYNNIFIIGSSHVMSFDGASVYSTGDFITPLGKLAVNRDIASKLIKDNTVFDFPVTAHEKEHSLEVQLPFIQHYFKNAVSIVPIIIGSQKAATIKQIAEALRPYFTPENLFIISSDFSHYPPYDKAREADRETALAIASGKPAFFLSALEKNAAKKINGMVTSMCGWTSGLTLMYLAEGNENIEFKLIEYSNSGDSPYGGKSEVVGYHAIALLEKTNDVNTFSFSEDEKKQLFSLARDSIKARFDNVKVTQHTEKLSPRLSEQLGVFVTLKIDGALRGCIGRFLSSDPLYVAVKSSAVSSAFNDPRFTPLSREEFEKADIEITVLGPLKKINSINELVLGRHGIYIKKDNRSGTMLPQVATEHGWTREEFLGYTSRDKAGIGWDGWKDAELFVYDGIVLQE